MTPRMNRYRRTIATGALTALAAACLTLLTATVAAAHGATTTPGSRTYLCFIDGHWTGGDLDPRNAACQNAITIGGKQPLWDWFGVLRSDGAGRMRGFVPDGQLCSGGNPKYAAYDVPRDDWPVTHLTSGADFTFHYAAWAPHPGTFRMFVTKDGYDPTQPLTWDSLEDQPFSTFTESVPNGTGEYFWDATLPAGKSGHHVIYSVWSRSDSQETFYGCADVVFDGGHGEVTGFPQNGVATPTPPPTTTTPSTMSPPPPPSTSTAPSTSPGTEPTGTDPSGGTPPSSDPPGTDPSGIPPGTTGAAPPPIGNPAATCTAMVNVQAWPGGYLGTVVVMNAGAAAEPWTVRFSVPPGLTLYTGWNADVTLNGTTVTADAPSWNHRLATGQEVSIGFVAAGPASPPPGDVTLNGVPC